MRKLTRTMILLLAVSVSLILAGCDGQQSLPLSSNSQNTQGSRGSAPAADAGKAAEPGANTAANVGANAPAKAPANAAADPANPSAPAGGAPGGASSGSGQHAAAPGEAGTANQLAQAGAPGSDANVLGNRPPLTDTLGMGPRPPMSGTLGLPATLQLALGTLKLEADSDLALTSEQAETLLPLWQQVVSLAQAASQNSQPPQNPQDGQSELQTAFEAVQAAMTDEQLAAIKEIEWSSDELAALAETYGIDLPTDLLATPDAGAMATMQAGGPGGQPPQGTPGAGGPGGGMPGAGGPGGGPGGGQGGPQGGPVGTPMAPGGSSSGMPGSGQPPAQQVSQLELALYQVVINLLTGKIS